MASTSDPASLSHETTAENIESSNDGRKRHEKYYIPGGDVVFRVEDTLFRVHKYFFERESTIFRDMLSLPAPKQGASASSANQQILAGENEGLSDENPIRLPQVSSKDFERFLWVFYNPTYSDYDAPWSTWTSILRLAHLWDFPSVRALAFKELENESPAMRLAIGERYDAPADWRARAMTELITRREPLTREEGEELGMQLVLKVAEMRERARGGRQGRPIRVGRRMDDLYDDYYGPHVVRHWRSRSRTRSRSRSPSPHPQPPIIIAPPTIPPHHVPPQIVFPPMPHPPHVMIPGTPPTPQSIADSERTSRPRRILRFFKNAFGKG